MNRFTKYKRQLQESAWLLGICENGYDDLKAGRIHWIDNGEYKGKKWFADPFILDYNDELITLLVEEFDYKVHRGRIAKLTIDRNNWTVTDCKIILDSDTHLSFPMIWREDNNVYVCPENNASGALNLYVYHQESDSLAFVKLLINEKLTDSILYKDEKGYYVFSTCVPTPNGKTLTVYRANNLAGDYKSEQKIRFSENIARNAGMIFEYKGQLIRPAQECNHTYGHAISFQTMRIDQNGFSFEETFRYHSSHYGEFRYGTHTYNQHPHGMAVIDVKGFRYKTIGKWMWILQQLLIKMHLKKEIWLQ
jgi:hypothetical protein